MSSRYARFRHTALAVPAIAFTLLAPATCLAQRQAKILDASAESHPC